jgi:hypothetical protein
MLTKKKYTFGDGTGLGESTNRGFVPHEAKKISGSTY